MKIKCDYCGSFIDDTEETCPNCGAVNEHLMRSADGVPKTIEELKAFCKLKNLPLEKMRFFIGVDYKQPKAFGIYKDKDGNFVVYKNKGNGTRVLLRKRRGICGKRDLPEAEIGDTDTP